jgi:TRAP-type C4-dicarboxylate transport system substrate-binding protein
MNADRRRFIAAASFLAAPAILRAGSARAAEVTLKMAHFLPPVAPAHAKLLKPWAEQVEAASDGRISIRIYPSMQLGGSPAQLFDQVRDGVADLAWTLPGYTPGRFPRLETFELPFVAAPTALVNAQAVQEFASTQLGNELSDVRLICAWAHDQGVIHSRRAIGDLAGMQGLKVRFPNRLTGEALTALGASAIGMPVPQVPESLASGVIDAVVVPWEVVPAVKIQELVQYHVQFPGTPTFYTATMLLAMNKASYEGLPDDLRAIIDAHTGIETAILAGKAFDEGSVAGKKAAEKRGNEITTLSEEEAERWRAKTQPVIDSWLAAKQREGVDGAKLLETAQALVAKYQQA